MVHTPSLWPGWLDDDAINTIDKARHAAGLTHYQLADKAGLGYGTVAGILTGRQHPTLEQVRRLCTALGIDVPARYSWIRT